MIGIFRVRRAFTARNFDTFWNARVLVVDDVVIVIGVGVTPVSDSNVINVELITASGFVGTMHIIDSEFDVFFEEVR